MMTKEHDGRFTVAEQHFGFTEHQILNACNELHVVMLAKTPKAMSDADFLWYCSIRVASLLAASTTPVLLEEALR